MNRSNALSDHLQVWGFENDFTIFTDGSYGFTLQVTPIDVSSFDDERVNALAKQSAQFLNGLPVGTDIQFIQTISRGNEAVLEEHVSLSKKSDSEFARRLCESRAERFREYDESGFIPKHGLRVCVRKAPNNSSLDRPKLFEKKKDFTVISEQRLREDLAEMTRLRDEVAEGLESLSLSVRALSASEMADALYETWNPNREISRGEYDPEDVRGSIVFTDVERDLRGFTLGETHFRVISLKLLPDQTFSSMATRLRELPFGSKLHLSISVPDQTRELESLQTQRRIAYSLARGKRSGVSDIESEAKLQDLETLLEEMIAQGEKVFQVSLNILLSSNDLENLNVQVSQALLVLRELGGSEGLEETLAAFPVYSEFSYPNARSVKERLKRMKTSNLCDFLPIFGPWPGFQKPSILLRTRMGSLFKFDPFSPELANSNQLVSGGSGSGKSFLTNLLLLQMLKENPKVYFVDIGGSYRKLCENLSGQYLPLGVDAGISLNPFDLAKDETTPSSQKIKFLVGLVELMTKEDGDARLPKLERAEIEEAIQSLYDEKRKPKLSDLREALLRHENAEIKRYGRILTPWCGDTPFGRFVDRETSIRLDRPIVAFDLKGMETYPDLQAVCLFLITDFVWREIQFDRSTMKFLVFDECWKLLKNDSGLVFIEEVFRTFRKYYASAIAISQDIDDFAKSKIAGAILPNCSMKWVLMQQSSDPARIKEALDLNDNEVELIKSLKQKKGSYSEAFLIAQKNRIVTVIESTPLEYWIATTDPRDLAKIEAENQIRPGASPMEILGGLSEEFPEGVAASEKRGRV